MQQAGAAVDVHRQELRINRALARLPQDSAPTEDELADAISRDPGAVRSVAIALYTLGNALRSAGEPEQALGPLADAVGLMRARAGLPSGARLSLMEANAKRRAVQLYELGQIGWGLAMGRHVAGAPPAALLEAAAESVRAFGAAALGGVGPAVGQVTQLLPQALGLALQLKDLPVLEDCRELVERLGLGDD